MDFLRFAKYPDCYYEFLQKADPANIPSFSNESINVLKYINFFLPVVREEEFQILKLLLDGPKSLKKLEAEFTVNALFVRERFEHALTVLSGKAAVNTTGNRKLIQIENSVVSLAFSVSDSAFSEYLSDVFEYGITKFHSDFASDIDRENGRSPIYLHLFGSYTMPTSFLALCAYKNGTDEANLMPMSGVNYTKKGLAIYITLNKDLSLDERLKYNDRFLSPSLMEWESSTSTTLENLKGKKLIQTKDVMIFVRKTKKSWGRNTPYIYIGTGTLTNPRPSNNPGKSLLFDVKLDHAVPKAYRYDLGLDENDEA